MSLGATSFGMEYPQGYATVGHAQCVVLDGIPTKLELAPDSDCKSELDNAGNRLGGGYRLAVYIVRSLVGPYPDVTVVDVNLKTDDIEAHRKFCTDKDRRLVSLKDAGHLEYLQREL